MLNSSSSASRSCSRLLLVRLDHLEHRADVVLDVEAAEDRGLLRQIADAEPRALIHRQRGDVVAVELDAAAVGLDQPGDHVEHRGLAGAVRPEQADRLAAPHVEARALHHLAAAEAFLHPMRGEIVAAARPAARLGCWRLPAGAVAGCARCGARGSACCAYCAACQSASRQAAAARIAPGCCA